MNISKSSRRHRERPAVLNVRIGSATRSVLAEYFVGLKAATASVFLLRTKFAAAGGPIRRYSQNYVDESALSKEVPK